MATWTNESKSSSPTWANQDKTSKTFGELTPIDIGGLNPSDNLPGTNPQITLGEANPNTKIFAVHTNQSKSATPTWTNDARN